MKDLSVVSIEDGILLGLRFSYEGRLRIRAIVGAEALEDAEAIVVQGFSGSDVLVQLTESTHLDEADLEKERQIHMLDEHWYSSQTGAFLLHQFRTDLRYNMVSPITALDALQRSIGEGISYFSKQREIFLNRGSIELLTPGAADGRAAYICGPAATRYAHVASSRVMDLSDMRIDLEHSLRSELQGLGHLFALTVGAAMHMVREAAPHTLENS